MDRRFWVVLALMAASILGGYWFGGRGRGPEPEFAGAACPTCCFPATAWKSKVTVPGTMLLLTTEVPCEVFRMMTFYDSASTDTTYALTAFDNARAPAAAGTFLVDSLAIFGRRADAR